jgi:hypothetical protein
MVKDGAVCKGQEPGYCRVISQQREVFVTQAGDLCRGHLLLEAAVNPYPVDPGEQLLTDFASLACALMSSASTRL